VVDEEETHLLLIDYLSGRDPDLWHGVADGWNWDHDTRVLSWIASQKNCDQATAQLIFWVGNPYDFLPRHGKPFEVNDYNKPRFEMLKMILQNWRDGFYSRQEIEFVGSPNPELALGAYRFYEAQCDQTLLPWTVPDTLGEPRPGRLVSSIDYNSSEGIPEEFFEILAKRDGDN
jgi:Domain of unknown function (DUF4274)